jgi:hypothetical protein
MIHQLCKVSGCANEGKYCRIPGHIDVQVKAKKPIAKYSPEREEINRKRYLPAQRIFLREHPFCELKLEGCTKIAEGVHHLDGKENIEKLLDTKRWKSACNFCNGRVEQKHAEAVAAGLRGSKHKPNYQRVKQ